MTVGHVHKSGRDGHEKHISHELERRGSIHARPEIDQLAGHRCEHGSSRFDEGSISRHQHEASRFQCALWPHEHGCVQIHDTLCVPARGPFTYACGGRRRVIEDAHTGSQSGCRKHGIDRGVVGQHDVDALGVADCHGGIYKRLGPVGLERSRLRQGSIPHMDELTAPTQRARKARSEETRTEDRNHA